MITYQRSKSWQMVLLALIVAAGGGAAYWWMHHEDDVQTGVVLANKAGGIAGWPQASTGNEDPDMALKPPVMQDGRPSDVQSEDWAALNAALAKLALPKGEAERIVGYLRYQHNFESWQTLDETKDAKRRQRMAQALLTELPERLASGEFTPIEANLMSAVLFADIEPDEAKRTQRMEEQQAKLLAIAPLNEDEQIMAAKTRQTELKRRQATAFGDWQAKTNPAERTPAKLEQSLQEVRRAYNSGEF
jgi:hypothetical protein